MKQAGYAVSAAIGAVVFVLVGYLVYASPGDSVGFSYWLRHPIGISAYVWAILGALIGAGIRFVAASR